MNISVLEFLFFCIHIPLFLVLGEVIYLGLTREKRRP